MNKEELGKARATIKVLIKMWKELIKTHSHFNNKEHKKACKNNIVQYKLVLKTLDELEVYQAEDKQVQEIAKDWLLSQESIRELEMELENRQDKLCFDDKIKDLQAEDKQLRKLPAELKSFISQRQEEVTIADNTVLDGLDRKYLNHTSISGYYCTKCKKKKYEGYLSSDGQVIQCVQCLNVLEETIPNNPDKSTEPHQRQRPVNDNTNKQG